MHNSDDPLNTKPTVEFLEGAFLMYINIKKN